MTSSRSVVNQEKAGAAAVKAAANRFAANVLPLIQPLRAEGKSLREIGEALGVSAASVCRILQAHQKEEKVA